MRIIVITILVLLSQMLKAEELDYNEYHAYIYKAEMHYYINKDVDSCFYYYDKAFDGFDYNFASDLVYACQIAFFEKRDYKKYLYKGFEYGLKIEFLKHIPLFTEVYNTLKEDTIAQTKYKEARARYLKTINFNYLYKMYENGIKEQVDKYILARDDDKYLRILKPLIRLYGFPGTKVLGIDDSNIFNEIGKPHLDLKSLKKKYVIKHTFKVKNYRIRNEKLTSKIAITMLFHVYQSYRSFEEIFKTAVKKGEMHPREVGLLYDNMFSYRSRKYYSTKTGVFLLNGTVNYTHLTYTDELVNSLRKKWNISSLEADAKKKELQKNEGFNLFLIYWGI